MLADDGYRVVVSQVINCYSTSYLHSRTEEQVCHYESDLKASSETTSAPVFLIFVMGKCSVR